MPENRTMRLRLISLFWLLCAVAGSSALCWGGVWLLAERRFQTGLKQAKADIAAQRFELAAKWLAAQIGVAA